MIITKTKNKSILVISFLCLFTIAGLYSSEKDIQQIQSHNSRYEYEVDLNLLSKLNVWMKEVDAVPDGVRNISRINFSWRHKKPQGFNARGHVNPYDFGNYPNGDGRDVYIEDVFIGIKTTGRYHSQRLPLMLDTWIPQANGSVYLVTDEKDSNYSTKFGELNYVNTACGKTHNRSDLMCKLQEMYETIINYKTLYDWWCLVEDDNYVIVPNLVKLLRNYNSHGDWYLGKPSNTGDYNATESSSNKQISFRYATSGAGICISRSLAIKMYRLCGKQRFIQKGKEINGTDDVTIGYVINYLLQVPLTVIPEFHSHQESMWELNPQELHKQITLSWSLTEPNVSPSIANRFWIRKEIPKFPLSVDKTRLLSVHCYLFPTSKECENIKKRLGEPS